MKIVVWNLSLNEISSFNIFAISSNKFSANNLLLVAMHLILFLLIISWEVHATKGTTEERELPILLIGLDATEIEKYTYPVVGEVSIVWPQERVLRLRCITKYAAYWDSTVAIKKYNLPIWFEDEFSEKEPLLKSNESNYLIDGTFIISHTTTGYISCQSIHEPLLRSRISIYGKGGINYINGKHPRSSKYEVKEVLDSCGTGQVLRSNIQSTQESSFVVLQNSTWFTNFPELGLFFNLNVFGYTDEIVTCASLQDSTIHLEIIKNVSTAGGISSIPRILPAYSSSGFPQSCEKANSRCDFYDCSNPFECDIKFQTSPPTSCANVKPSQLRLGMRIIDCKENSSQVKEYIFTDDGNNQYLFPTQFPQTPLIRLTIPDNQIFVLNEVATVICSAPVFMLSPQIVFALHYRNNSLKYLRDPDENREVEEGFVKRNASIYVDETLDHVTCLSPWFTFDKWIRTELLIEPKINKTPSVQIDLKILHQDDVVDGDDVNGTTTHKICTSFETISVTCFATGFPTPNVTWIHEPLTNVLISHGKNVTHRWNIITFHEKSTNINGSYRCEATNNNGEATAAVMLLATGCEGGLNWLSLTAVVVSCVLILILVVGSVLFWMKKSRRNTTG